MPKEKDDIQKESTQDSKKLDIIIQELVKLREDVKMLKMNVLQINALKVGGGTRV